MLDFRDRLLEDAAEQLLRRLEDPTVPAAGENDYRPMTRLSEIESRISDATEQVLKIVPDYFERASGAPVDLKSARAVIRPGEALVTHNVTNFGVFVACLTPDRASFQFKQLAGDDATRIKSDAKLIFAAVRDAHPPSAALDATFPVDSSARLYQVFLGGLDECLSGKTHVLLATDPTLFALPWNALVRNSPAETDSVKLRDVDWLPKALALSLLPSVGALHRLRTGLPPSRAQRKFLGIGNPDLAGEPQHSTAVALSNVVKTRGVANRADIENLPRLPETADELKAAAEALGDAAATLIVGEAATERTVRNLPLHEYKVISFATHALSVGDVEGVTEPALVLTPGAEGYAANDGLLTASEIANLSLDANLVILSACNTAAPDVRGGYNLGGLANAFFFAGARAVAVTQWSIFSEVAQKLGAGFVARSAEHDVGLAEGLRQTMVTMVAQAPEDYLAHPRFWAPYHIAGDGAVKALEGRSDGPVKDAIAIEWEHVDDDASLGELFGLAKSADGGSYVAGGTRKPPLGKKTAGSYLSALDETGRFGSPTNDADIAVERPYATSVGLATFAFSFSPERKSAAVFRLIGIDGKELWRFIEDGPELDYPVDIVELADRFILVSIADKADGESNEQAIVLNVVSKGGAPMARRKYPLSTRFTAAAPYTSSMDARGNLLLAVPGTATSARVGSWIHPKAGWAGLCSAVVDTTLVAIDTGTLTERLRETVENFSAVRMHRVGNHVYLAGFFSESCGALESAALFELAADLKLRPIHRSANVNSLDVRDFAVTADGFVVVGAISTFLPSEVARDPKAALERIMHRKWWDDVYWDLQEAPNSAFIEFLDRDGKVIADRIFPDARNRRINAVIQTGPDRFIGVGSAADEQGWTIALRSNVAHAAQAPSGGPH